MKYDYPEETYYSYNYGVCKSKRDFYKCKKVKFVKEYQHDYGLYIDEEGHTVCIFARDLGLIPKTTEKPRKIYKTTKR